MRLLVEDMISLAEAARRLPGKPHPATISRWQRHGLKGKKLETVVVGGRRYTSVEALSRFIDATTRARETEPPALAVVAAIVGERTTAHVDRDLAGRAADAGRQLKQLGPRAK